MKEIESEKQLERLLKSTVELTMHGLCLKLLSQHMIGLPDRLCLLPKGKAFFVEVKTTGKKQNTGVHSQQAESPRLPGICIRLVEGAPYYIN